MTNKVGRPTIKTPELTESILRLLSEGNSLKRICKMDEMPEMNTIWRWIRTDEEFGERYAQAKQESADAFSEEIIQLADDTIKGKYDAASARVAIDAYKWTAAKLKPKRYGDKVDLTSNGERVDVIIYKPERKGKDLAIEQEPVED